MTRRIPLPPEMESYLDKEVERIWAERDYRPDNMGVSLNDAAVGAIYTPCPRREPSPTLAERARNPVTALVLTVVITLALCGIAVSAAKDIKRHLAFARAGLADYVAQRD